ncbi:MAG: hypothetical protein M0009_02190 [Deltaproteobacteria bacterium]|nr:hypothetical protein [Deltaproteobacteria bacterium]
MDRGKLRRLLADPASPALLRGEIWIDPQVPTKAGFAPGPRGLIGFATDMGADICFLPWTEGKTAEEGQALAALAHRAGLDCALVIDGPFQRLAARHDLCTLLGELAGNPKGFAARLDREKAVIMNSVDEIGATEIDLILIGEDVGYRGGLYFAPECFRDHLLPFYQAMIQRFRSEGFAWGWHSDGSVEPLLPDLLGCGFQCFSLEPECVDLLRFKKLHGPRMCLIGGIRAEWLTAEVGDREWEAACLEEIGALIREGGLVLASTCGLYRPEFLPNLKRLYQLIGAFPPLPGSDPGHGNGRG